MKPQESIVSSMSDQTSFTTMNVREKLNSNSHGLDLCYEMVREFQVRFNNPISNLPSGLTEERRQIRFAYMLEEIIEFREANNIEDQSDAVIDLIYFALGTLVEMGVTPQRIFEIVHEANMNKLDCNGRPRHDPTNGKVAKPLGWHDPRPKVLQEIRRQEQRKQEELST